MVAVFVLVHSPLVGPVTWSWVAEELRQQEWRVVVPDLTQAVRRGGWRACVEAVVRPAPGDETILLAGHSGAGPLLPVIADLLGPRCTRLLFVDAVLPPSDGVAPLVPDQFRDSLRALTRDGVLPKWSDWFGPGTIDVLVPDPHRRAAVVNELPELPLSYFDDHDPMPDAWNTVEGAYILLSDPYRPDAAAAASRSWPVIV